MGEMKIHAYKVESEQKPLEVAIKLAANQKDIIDRNHTVAKKVMRLESYEKKGKLFFMDIAKLRDAHGPGKAKKNKLTEGIPMEEGSDFSELTAALYDQESQRIIVQYNHSGARGGAIASYFSKFDTGKYKFEPELDEEVMAKFLKMEYTSKIEIKVAPSKITEADLKEGVALGTAIQYNEEIGSNVMMLTLHRDRESSGWLGFATKLVKKMIGSIRKGKKRGFLKAVHVTGKESLDAVSETLDLLNHRLVDEIEIEFDNTKRYPVQKRWQALRSSFNEWRHKWR